MKYLTNKFLSFWFSPMMPHRLAILRVATGGFALWYLWTRLNLFHKVSKTDIALFEPVGIAKALAAPLPAEWFNYILILTIILNVLYLIGWRFKWTGPLFAILFLFTMCYRNSWSMIYHNYNALTLHILVLGFVASADVLSYDAWRKKLKGKVQPIIAQWHYGWAIRLICAATAATYVLSGLAKVYGELAWEWVTGSAMRSQVAVDTLRKAMLVEGDPSVFEWLYPYTFLFLCMGLLTMILELGAPIALVNRRLALTWVVLTCMMHWGILFIMGIKFPYQTSGFVFLAFLPVEQLWFRLQAWMEETTKSLTSSDAYSEYST